MSMLELAARCEAAEGPDRELDALIESATSGRRPWANPQITIPADQADYYEVPEGDYSGANLHLVGLPLMKAAHPEGEWKRGPNDRPVVKNQNRHYSPRFTASLDAAMSLVPEGCLWNVGCTRNGKFGACVSDFLVDTDYPDVTAATPALALCAASLKALATQSDPLPINRGVK